MKKILPLAFVGLAACVPPPAPVPGFQFTETVQAVEDSLPGGFAFVQNIPFVAVTRINEEPLTSADFNLAFTALRQYCGSKGAAFSGNGTDLTLGLPTFRDGAWLIAGQCLVTQAAPTPAAAAAEAVVQ